MTRRVPLPKITECVDNRLPKGGISRGHLMRGCIPFAVIGALCLAQVHLQFARADLLMQTSELQMEHRVLQRRLAIIERKAHEIDFEQLKIQGRRVMSMQEAGNPTKDLLATIPASVQRKYSEPLQEDASDVMVAQIRAERKQQVNGIKESLLSLVESGRAMASVRGAE